MSINDKYNSPDSKDFIKDLDQTILKFKEFFSGGGDGNGNDGGKILKIILIVILVIGGLSSFYTVQPDEEAILLRFGKYTSKNPPGLHFKIPFGVDRVIKLKTKQILQEEFGFRTVRTSGTGSSSYRKSAHAVEGLMLTGDLNIADVEWVVQYQIADPYKFVFATSNPQKNIRDVSEAIIRRVVGDRFVNAVFERTGMATEAKILIQEVLDKYDMGIRIIAIEFQDVLPPDIVRPSFNEVNAARQELEKLINKAESRYNKVIPEARGKAEQTIAEAEGKALAMINKAQGDADKFSAILTEYKAAPEITKERLYLEAMEAVYSKIKGITVVDPAIKGLLPIFSQGKFQNEIKTN